MANEIARGGNGQVRMRVESSLGTSAASWMCLRMDGMPNIKPSTMKLIAAGVGGHRNPLSVDKPVACEVYAQDAFTIKSRIHRAAVDGEFPIMKYLFEAAGWQANVGEETQCDVGSTTTSVVTDDASDMVAGEASLVEVSSGLYQPMLIASKATNTLTPSIALPSAPAENAFIGLMHTFTPTTLTGYQIPTDKTLQFTWNTLGYYNNAVGDASILATACAVSSLGAIEIGSVGSPITMDWGFHAGSIAPQEDDIAADDFQDSSPFVVVNEDAQFAISATNAGSGIGTLVTKNFQKITYNPGLTVVVIPGQGGTNVNGLQGFLLMQTPPTLQIDCLFNGDTAFSRMFLDELLSDNTSLYTHFVQPTRNLDNPAFGVWMPNGHLMPGSEPTIDITGDMLHLNATLVGDLSNWGGSSTDIDEVAASPIVIGVSSQAAA